MSDPKSEIGQFLGKALMAVAYIAIGVCAKLAVDSRNKDLNWKQVVIKSALSIFCGFVAFVICSNTGNTKWGGVVVPVTTLLGESLVIYVMTNWKKLAVRYFLNNKTKRR